MHHSIIIFHGVARSAMKIFLTGATGFIGKRLLKRLAVDGHSITSLLLPEEPESLLDGLKTAVVRGDVTAPGTLEGLLDGSEAVIHLAGAVGYGQAMAHCIRLNAEGTRNIASAAAASGVRRFIHFSSVSVYGRVPGVHLAEDSPRRRIGDPYGDTKIMAEEILEDFIRRGALDVTIVRPTVIYGPGDRLFLPKLIENIRSGRARVIGPGDNTVDLVHVDDVAEFTALLLKTPGSSGRVYNLTNRGNPTWKEFLGIVAGALGVPAPAKHLPYPVAYAVAGLMELISAFTGKQPLLTRYSVRVVGRKYFYITDRAKDELGFVPGTDLGKAIVKLVREAGAAG
jgi:2-alkyl-3-oxoalkanoate reductase